MAEGDGGKGLGNFTVENYWNFSCRLGVPPEIPGCLCKRFIQLNNQKDHRWSVMKSSDRKA